ncbi:MAG: hypothetical protein ACOCYE_02080, partial [Pseudomonadota bacterium]
MDEGRSRAAWDHTSAIVATLINVNRGKNTRPVKIKDVHPHEQRAPLPLTAADVRKMFRPRNSPRNP